MGKDCRRWKPSRWSHSNPAGIFLFHLQSVWHYPLGASALETRQKRESMRQRRGNRQQTVAQEPRPSLNEAMAPGRPLLNVAGRRNLGKLFSSLKHFRRSEWKSFPRARYFKPCPWPLIFCKEKEKSLKLWFRFLGRIHFHKSQWLFSNYHGVKNRVQCSHLCWIFFISSQRGIILTAIQLTVHECVEGKKEEEKRSRGHPQRNPGSKYWKQQLPFRWHFPI